MGTAHACVVHNGAVKCWGTNNTFQLGMTQSRTPIALPGLGSGITTLVVAANHNCVIQSGALKCWGSNSTLQLAQPAGTAGVGTATVMPGYASDVRAVGVGTYTTCGVRAGVLGCWGSNYIGQLAAPGPSKVPIAVATSGLSAPEPAASTPARSSRAPPSAGASTRARSATTRRPTATPLPRSWASRPTSPRLPPPAA